MCGLNPLSCRIDPPPPPSPVALGGSWIEFWSKRVLEMWERHFLCGLETSNSTGEMTTHHSSPTLWHDDIHSLHPVQLLGESTNVKRLGEDSQEAACSNLFPCQPQPSPLEFYTIRWPSLPPAPLSIPFPALSSPHLFLFLLFLLSAVRKNAWFMKLYFYQLLRKRTAEKEWQRKGEKKLKDW